MTRLNTSSLFEITLYGEAASAALLIQESISLLYRQRFAHRTDPLFACLSLAMEKTLKLSIGLSRLADGDHWPNVSEMKGFKHDIASMNSMVTTLITERADSASNPSLVLAALGAASADPHIPAIVGAMSDYARSGRFHDLDFLAEMKTSTPASEETAWLTVGDRPSPRHLWWQIEQSVLTPELLAETTASSEIPSPWARRLVNAVERSLTVWTECQRTAWLQGVFGQRAKALATELDSTLWIREPQSQRKDSGD